MADLEKGIHASHRAGEVRAKPDSIYKAILDGAAEGILIAEIATMRFLFANPAICKMLGYSEEELRGKSVPDLHPRESIESVIAEFQAQARGEKTLASNQPCLKKDGTVFFADICSKKSLLDGIECNIGFFTDVTERKLAKDALRENQQRYQALVENINDWAWELDHNGTFTYSSPAVKNLLGYEPSELIGKTPFDLMPPEEADNMLDIFQRYVEAKQQVVRLESIHLHKQGRQVMMEVSGLPIIDAKGYLVGYRGISRDISERKWAEAIQEREERFKDITYSMADWIWEVDKHGKYTFSSTTAGHILGYEPKEILGKTPFEFMPPAEAERVEKIFQEIATAKKPIVELENWNLTKSGEKVCLLTNGVPFLDEKGELLGYRGVDKDITESKKAEEEIKQQHLHQAAPNPGPAGGGPLGRDRHHRLRRGGGGGSQLGGAAAADVGLRGNRAYQQAFGASQAPGGHAPEGDRRVLQPLPGHQRSFGT